MKLFTTLLLSVFALCSCAQMTVNVSILDRKFWSSPEQLSNSISMQVAEVAMNRGNGTFAHGHMKIKALTRQALLDLAKAGQLDPNDVERLARLLSNFVDNGFKEAAEHFERAFKLLVTASEVPPPNDRLAILFKAQSELDAGRATMIGVEEQISADLRRQVSAAKNGSRTQAVRILNEAQSKIQKTLTGLIGDRGILEDPLASAVVFAEESYWRRPDSPGGINETYATGIFGNTDIAVKMESVGSFTIKGVRLDASKITQATFAVGRQAVKTVAALYGIPMPVAETKMTQPTSVPFAETTIGFKSPDRRRADAEEELLRRRLARLMLMETILIQRKALTDPATTAETRATAVDTVKKLFTANRVQLDGPAASKE